VFTCRCGTHVFTIFGFFFVCTQSGRSARDEKSKERQEEEEGEEEEEEEGEEEEWEEEEEEDPPEYDGRCATSRMSTNLSVTSSSDQVPTGDHPQTHHCAQTLAHCFISGT